MENVDHQEECFTGISEGRVQVGATGAIVIGILTQVQMQAKNPAEGLGYHNGCIAKVSEVNHEER